MSILLEILFALIFFCCGILCLCILPKNPLNTDNENNSKISKDKNPHSLHGALGGHCAWDGHAHSQIGEVPGRPASAEPGGSGKGGRTGRVGGVRQRVQEAAHQTWLFLFKL